jgi:hypothetical protein
VGLLSFALIAPKPSHAHGSPQFPGLSRLLTRNCKCMLEIGFRFRRIRLGRHQRDFASRAIDLGFAPPFLACFDRLQQRRSTPRRWVSAVLYGSGRQPIVQTVRSDQVVTKAESLGLIFEGQIEIRNGDHQRWRHDRGTGRAVVREGDRVVPVVTEGPFDRE